MNKKAKNNSDSQENDSPYVQESPKNYIDSEFGSKDE